MKVLAVCFSIVLLLAAPALAGGWIDQYGNYHQDYYSSGRYVEPNSYGHGINMDTYARPHVYRDRSGFTDPTWNVQRDAYGPGVHMNQYGRPVYDSTPSW